VTVNYNKKLEMKHISQEAMNGFGSSSNIVIPYSSSPPFSHHTKIIIKMNVLKLF
jgi:hypothetical protein